MVGQMSKRLFRLVHTQARQGAIAAIGEAPDGYIVEVKEPTRSLEANALMWCLLTELSKQTDWHGIKLSPDEFKDLLSAGLVKSKVVPNIEGNGFVVLGQRTSKMSKREMSELVELIYAFGSQRGVVFADDRVAA